MATSRIEDVPLSAIQCDMRYQRPLDANRVRKMQEEFELGFIGLPVVSLRADGTYWAIDGNHRLHFYRGFLGDVNGQKVECRVWEGLSLADEAQMFVKLNATAPVKRYHKFLAAVTAGEPEECAVDNVVRSARLRVGENGLLAVHALVKVYRGGRAKEPQPEALRRTLVVMRDAWGADGTMLGDLIEGIGMVFVRCGDMIDDAALTAKLAHFPGGARGLSGRARGWRENYGGHQSDAVSDLLVSLYNKGRRTHKLPDWRAQR